MRAPRLALVALLSVLSLAACGGSPVKTVNIKETFAAPPATAAVTYDPALVPLGATAAVETVPTISGSGTKVVLRVTGLQPNRAYGAHAHTMPCGADGMAAGPHYQFRADPVKPSVDPMFANPQNEIWLDFTTTASGAALVAATVPWNLPADRRPKSIVIHEKPTSSAPGQAGTAGARPACITVPF